MRTIITTSGNGILQMLIATTSWIGLFKILSAFGSAAIAGYTIAIRIATRFNAMFLGIVGAVFVILAYPLAGLFTTDPETLSYAARGLSPCPYRSRCSRCGAQCSSSVANGSCRRFEGACVGLKSDLQESCMSG